MKSKISIYLTLLLFSFATSCSETSPKPKDLLPEDQYINMLVELQLLRTYGENAALDTTTVDSLKTEIFQKYQTTLETFQNSHQYYLQSPKEQQKRLEEAIERLKMDQLQDTTTSAAKEKRPSQ